MKIPCAITWLVTLSITLTVGKAMAQESPTGTNIVVVPVLQVPTYLPTCTNVMTAPQAAAFLGLSAPVVVTGVGAYEDGGTYAVVLTDAQGKHLAFHRSPWAWDTPVFYYLDSLREDGKSAKLQYDSKELKALSVLCLNWADTTFTKDQQRQIFKKEGRHAETENDLLHILFLFRPRVFDEWRAADMQQ